MKRHNINAGLLIIALMTGSCNKYLDVQPKGYTLLNTTEQYNQWLNNPELQIDRVAGDIAPMPDNRDYANIPPTPIATGDLIYLWYPQFKADINATPPIWAPAYNTIYTYNTVLDGVKESLGSSDLINSIYAEALVGRAYQYLWLVNLYGKQYDSSTSNADLAVPFVTDINISAKIPLRLTVQNLYNRILADLNEALPNLPIVNSANRSRASVSVAYSIMARAYYYMGNWPQAQRSAALALSNDPTLKMIDYNTMADASKFPASILASDNIYFRRNAISGYTSTAPTTPTLSFLRSFGPGDLRLKLFYANVVNNVYTPVNGVYDSRGKVSFTGYGILRSVSNLFYHNSGPSVVEMKLILAEAAARQDDLTSALKQLDDVRKCRTATASYTAFSSADKEVVIQKILAERSFEFAFTGLRWLDMRKLDKEGRMSEITRYNNTGTSIIATLAPHSERYTLQIPDNVILFNPDMPQNP